MNNKQKKEHMEHRSRFIGTTDIYVIWNLDKENNQWEMFSIADNYYLALHYAEEAFEGKAIDYKITKIKISSDSETKFSYFKELEENKLTIPEDMNLDLPSEEEREEEFKKRFEKEKN